MTNRGAVWGLAGLTVPLTAVLGLIVWRIRIVEVISDRMMWILLAAIVALLALQLRLVFKVNEPALRGAYAVGDRYQFRSVSILSLAYFCNFGSELAIVSMLPIFFADTWNLTPTVAGLTASGFAFMNLVARPAGGLMSDLLGSRRRTLQFLLLGLGVGYCAMAFMGPSWPVLAAVAVTMLCSLFVQSSEGAVFAIVPLVKKRVSGQIAGLVGASGNVGAIVFLTALLFVSPQAFFLIIGAASLLANLACRWLPEPDAGFAGELVEDAGSTSVLEGAGTLAGAPRELEPQPIG